MSVACFGCDASSRNIESSSFVDLASREVSPKLILCAISHRSRALTRQSLPARSTAETAIRAVASISSAYKARRQFDSVLCSVSEATDDSIQETREGLERNVRDANDEKAEPESFKLGIGLKFNPDLSKLCWRQGRITLVMT